MNFSYPQLSTENVLVSQVILEFLLIKFLICFSDESGSLISFLHFLHTYYLPLKICTFLCSPHYSMNHSADLHVQSIFLTDRFFSVENGAASIESLMQSKHFLWQKKASSDGGARFCIQGQKLVLGIAFPQLPHQSCHSLKELPEQGVRGHPYQILVDQLQT